MLNFKTYRESHKLPDIALLLVDKLEIFERKDRKKIAAQDVLRLLECEEKFFAIIINLAERFQSLRFGSEPKYDQILSAFGKCRHQLNKITRII